MWARIKRKTLVARDVDDDSGVITQLGAGTTTRRLASIRRSKVVGAVIVGETRPVAGLTARWAC
jgi:hypothetical protein